MKYMLLIDSNKRDWDEMPTLWSDQDVKVMVEYMHDLNRDLQASGELVEVRGLTGPANMKTVHADDDGEAIVTDGPFTETKEVLAGYWVIDVASEQRAVEIALRVSLTPGPGGRPTNQNVEIHPADAEPPA
ncbi:YciI family protein [Kribbella sp. NPDC051770]|uniref:YciI family protein n=1 Tax=Kribbella sp. NPDC051770 TaxID=3155413 RepID=UPI0034171BF6